MARLARRLLTAAVLLPVTFAAVYSGPIPAALLLATAAVMGVRELRRIGGGGGRETIWVWSICTLFLIAVQGEFVAVSLSAAVVTVVGVGWIAQLLLRRERMLIGVAQTLFCALYLGLLPAHLLAFYSLGTPGSHDARPVVFALLLVWGSDTAAFAVGTKFGLRKLWPRISPSKTREGAIAGVAVPAIVGGLLEGWIPGLGRLGGASAGAVVGIVAQIGDLGESLMKREAAMKDSGRSMPGHGGVLDRLDSLVLAVPALYYWIRFWVGVR